MEPYSPEELARILERDHESGRSIARTLAMVETQMLSIPPRAERPDNFWIRCAASLDGYNVSLERHGEELHAWVNRHVWRDRTSLTPDDLREFSILDLRLLLFQTFRRDYFSGGDSGYDALANDILDVLREKLETDS